jgi:hypothetical protein
MPSSGDDTGESKSQRPLTSDDASSAAGICPEQAFIIDRLCRCGTELNAVAAEVRNAVAQDNLDDLERLRQQFDMIREEIIDRVYELSRHRLEHRCQP